MSEVGVALDTNEDTARKRVSRSVEKLRKFFTKRGTVLSAATLIGLLSANTVSAAPAGLASTIAAGAILKGTLESMAWTKLKTAAVVGAAVILGGGTTGVVVNKLRSNPVYEEGTQEWQVRNFDSRILQTTPPQVMILPARFPRGAVDLHTLR